jgi:hypothetical protein
MSPDLLLVANDYFGYSKCYNGDIEFPSSDLDSPQKMGLGAN